MSRVVSGTETVSSHPVSYDSGYQAASTSNLQNAYADSDNTSYAQINLTTGGNAETYIFYNFGLDIPSNATITSVSCSCKCSINQTNTNKIATRQAQLYSGSTAKGSASTVANSTTVFNITTGSWTASELNNAKIRLYAKRGTNNTTNNYYFRFYGATLSVTYSYDYTLYTVTSSSLVSGVAVEPASQEVKEHESATVILGTGSGYKLTDNNADVTSLINTWAPHTYTSILTNYNSSVSNQSTSSVNYTNACTDTSSTTFATLYGGTQYYYFYDFGIDISSIPSDATITDVSINVKAVRYSANYTWQVVLCKNTTEISDAYANIAAYTNYGSNPTGAEIYNITSTSFTRSELSTLKIKAKPTYNSTSARLFLYGADITINYTANGYSYTISNITADHVVVAESDSGAVTVYVKKNGSWTNQVQIYAKTNGSWVLGTVDVERLFHNSVIYVKG